MDLNDINKKLSSLSKDFDKQLNELDSKADDISNKTKIVQNYLTNLIKDKCYEPFQYLEKNGRILESENDFLIKINPKHKTERILAKFHKCLDDNDKNIRLFYANLLFNQTNTRLDHVNNLKKCVKADNQTECFKDAISDSIYSMNYLYDNILTDLNNIISNRI
jgi:hypothetical protein